MILNNILYNMLYIIIAPILDSKKNKIFFCNNFDYTSIEIEDNKDNISIIYILFYY